MNSVHDIQRRTYTIIMRKECVNILYQWMRETRHEYQETEST